MKRNEFIRTGLFGLVATQGIAWCGTAYSELELVGKGRPELVGDPERLLRPVYTAYKKMQSVAAADGMKLFAASSYRSFAHQKRIWNRKYRVNRQKGMSGPEAVHDIIRLSTIPGTSRHHWGTEVDLIDLGVQPQPKNKLTEANFRPGGAYHRLQLWLENHAKKIGFHLVYNNDPQRNGFLYEPWHYSFAELSVPMLRSYLNINWKYYLLDPDISGREFLTDRFLDEYSSNHILGISPGLKKNIRI